VIHVVCKGSNSLRDAICNDPRLEDSQLHLVCHHKQDRPNGWAKLRSTEGYAGAVNIVWDGTIRTLTGWIVTRNGNKPSKLAGAFIAYLLKRHGRRIVSLTLSPES
jgi:hypothetical protein